MVEFATSVYNDIARLTVPRGGGVQGAVVPSVDFYAYITSE